MPGVDLGPARSLLAWFRCCPRPGAVTGLDAGPGGGSGEVTVSWKVRPVSEQVEFYRVYRRAMPGQYRCMGIVTAAAAPVYPPGRLGYIDIEALAEQCYVISAVNAHGVEGPLSGEICGSP